MNPHNSFTNNITSPSSTPSFNLPSQLVEVPTTKKVAVVLRGFLVLDTLPSPERISYRLDMYFKDIRIGKEILYLLSSFFKNRLANLRSKYYNNIRDKYAVFCGRLGYIVPRDKVNDFIIEVRKLKKEYMELENQIKEFLRTGRLILSEEQKKRLKKSPKMKRLGFDDVDEYVEYLEEEARKYIEIIKEYLAQRGIDWEKVIEKISIVDGVKIDLCPIAVDLSMIEEFVDERVKEELRRQAYEVRKEILENAKKDIEERVKNILAKLREYAEKKITEKVLEKLKQDYDEIVKMCEEFGVKIPTLELLGTMIEEPLKIIREAKSSEAASERVKALLEQLDLNIKL